jgi:hypothetical protein
MVCGYNVETKMQSTQWVEKFAKTKKGAAGQVERESYVDFFFYIEGIVHH